MKKLAVIIGKKQIIMACLTMILAVAVYVNYAVTPDSMKNDIRSDTDASEEYGESRFVNAGAGDLTDMAALDADDYFANARMERTMSRDQTVQTLQSVMGGGDITENEAVVNALAAVELTKMTELESRLENLIKSRGYSDCLVYLDEDDARVVVRTDGLDTASAAAIKDILLSESTISAQNIRIFEVK